jgi:hypothetical protein
MKKVNIFTNQYIIFWVKPVEDGFDFDIKPAKVEDYIGKKPKWFTEYIKENGLDFFVPWGLSDAVVNFCLLNGIAPNQNFSIRVEEPTYTCDYWGECDEDIDVGICDIEPIDDAEERWSKYIKNRKILSKKVEIDSIKKEIEIEENPQCLQIITTYRGKYSERKILTLTYVDKQKHWRNKDLIFVEDEDFDKADEELFYKINLMYPNLTANDIYNIPIITRH